MIPNPSPRRRGLRATLAALAGAVLLAACGGGTSQVEDFVPVRMFAFGDESSLLLPGGQNFSVNPLTAAGTPDCTAEPIWVQAVARNYRLVFAECNPDAVADPRAHMLAVAGAREADLAVQVDAALALAQRLGPGCTVATLACDSGLKYLSTDLYRGVDAAGSAG